ncbi:hypothetical protein Leryth_022894 [Lithospermum erythrorhizon]|nr:hypothetical protein Leryth_022894 [Lithospermum erythrorhizon]
MNSGCKTLARSSFSLLYYNTSIQFSLRPYSSHSGIKLQQCKKATRCCFSTAAAISAELSEDLNKDTVEDLLVKKKDVGRLMKMERKLELEFCSNGSKHWFPYLDKFTVLSGNYLNSAEVLEAMDPYIMDMRKERFRNAVKNRSYSVCLVVEGLADFGNVSAAFRSADAMGIQSVHVVSCDSSKRCKVY